MQVAFCFWALVSALLLATLSCARSEPPSRATLDRVAASVLRVEVSECGSMNPATGTGFLWGSANQVVTALHLIAGCSNLTIHSEQLGQSFGVEPSSVLVAADLALLRAGTTLSLPLLEPSAALPALHEDLAVLAYSLGAQSLGDRIVRLAYGSSRLREIVSPDVGRELQQNGTPSLDLDVLRLDGVQVPGNSGAPVLNRDGKVVGISDGGLEQGISSINWAVPAALLSRLATSADIMPANPMRTRENFAAELDSSPGQTLRCGEITFTNVRTRPFDRLQQTTDDPVALQQVLASATVASVRTVAGLRYDVWVNAESGGAIALPTGSTPQVEGSLCVVHGRRPLTVHFGGMHVATPADTQLRSLEFEQIIERAHGVLWQADPTWTYAFPHINGLEGVVLKRNSGYGIDLTVGRPTSYVTETLMARGNIFIGIASVIDEYDPQTTTACRMMMEAPVCATVESTLETWLRYALGVLLSTFAPR